MIITNVKKLRKVCEEVPQDEDVKTVARDLFMAALASKRGAGLAANQIGVQKRNVLICAKGALKVVVNPVIKSTDGEWASIEGCLSLPGQMRTVSRPEKVSFSGFTTDWTPHAWELEGVDAAAFCHEMDHLDGILIIDKARADGTTGK